MRRNAVRAVHLASLVWHGNRRRVPIIAPRIEASVRALRGVLPLPFMREAFACPRCIGARILECDPRHGFVPSALWRRAVLPVEQKIQVVLGMVMRSIEKFFELLVGYWIFVDPERLHVHHVF